MSFLNDEVFDSGLDWFDANAIRLDICDTEPTSYGEATTDGTHSLGYKIGIAVAAPADRTGGGRQCTISAITDGTVTETSTANYWAITDNDSVLVAVGDISTPQGVTDGNTFTLTEFEVGIPDPA